MKGRSVWRQKRRLEYLLWLSIKGNVTDIKEMPRGEVAEDDIRHDTRKKTDGEGEKWTDWL